jgi:hypothetical protein
MHEGIMKKRDAEAEAFTALLLTTAHRVKDAS